MSGMGLGPCGLSTRSGSTATDRADVGRVGRPRAREAADAQQAAVDAAVAEALQEQAVAQASAIPVEAPAVDGDDLLAKLEKLADLKAAGVLDDAEFAAPKAQLLA